MRRAKLFILLALCFSVLHVGMAQAAMLCCQPDQAQSMQAMADMPCHDTADGNNAAMDCDCTDCVQSSMILWDTVFIPKQASQRASEETASLRTLTLHTPIPPPNNA